MKYYVAIAIGLCVTGCLGVEGGVGPLAFIQPASATVPQATSAEFNALGLEGGQVTGAQWHLREPQAGVVNVSGAVSEHATFTAGSTSGTYHLDVDISVLQSAPVHKTATIVIP